MRDISSSFSSDPTAPAGRAGGVGESVEHGERAGIAAVLSSMLALVFGPSALLILSFGTFMPELHATFGWSLTAISLGGSIISITIMVVSPVQGFLVDRFGVRIVALVSVPVWGTALMLMRFLPGDITFFYLACLLLPLAALGIWPLVHMKLATTWFDRHLGLAMGSINLSVGIAAAVLPVALASAFATFGLRETYTLLGAIVLVIVWPAVALWFRQGPRGAMLSDTAVPLGIAFGAVVRTRVFWMMMVSFLILGLVSTGLLIHQVAILVDAGFPTVSAIYLQSTIGIGSIFGRIGTGWLLDRVAVQKVGFGMFLVAAAACLLLASPLTMPLAVIAAAMVGVVIGAEFDVLGMLIRRYQGIAAFGRIFGVVFSAFQLGGALGAAAMGIGRAELGSYAPALVTMAIMCLLGGILFPFYGAYRFEREMRGTPMKQPPQARI